MLLVSLVGSLILIVIQSGCARTATGNSVLFWVGGIGLVLALGDGIGLFLPTLALHLLLVALLAGFAAMGAWPWRRTVRRGMILAAAAYAPATVYALVEERTAADLRRHFPMRSIAHRLPALPPPNHPPADRGSIYDGRMGAALLRGRSYRLMHTRAVERFVTSPGFGVIRGARGLLAEPSRPPEPWPAPPQPGLARRDPATPDPDDRGGPTDRAEGPRPSAQEWHRENAVQFVRSQDFGYVRDRDHVAGFEPHGFVTSPGAPQGVEIDTIELVGILVAPEPRVYVSDKLPSMEEVRTVPTRPPDAFESAALARLRAGEELVADRDDRPKRLLGAIRSAAVCVQCHGGGGDELLGAFSYRLARSGRPPRPVRQHP